ncbi:MAG: DUF4293 domain-containing protein, partial [Saprospiraceae bacterium]|nr:DUF4293 domain-containing protein [Saprospiraceae bacterium]
LFSDSLPFVSVFGDESNLLNTSQTILDDGVFDISDHILLIALVCISVLLSFVSIFLFKNRPLQIKLSRINLVLTALLFILSIFLFYQAYDSLAQGAEVSIEYGYVNPFLTILFLVLAIRYIARDEKLVRSSDRLR